MTPPDALGTAALRAAVVEAWLRSPARLREDANHEEDHARSYYRDRVLVELAQNAADAAARAGTPGRLLLRLTTATAHGPATMLAANTGAPLDAAGLASLATLRASTKRDTPGGGGVVGRFGVGFAAVRAVADEIVVVSRLGAARFSLELTRRLLDDLGAGHPLLAEEVALRGDALPVLRVPFPAAELADVPDGFDTAVLLTLRDADAERAVRALLADVDDPLLLALPALDRVDVEEVDPEGRVVRRTVTGLEDRWVVQRAAGRLTPELLADRPVEERASTGWRVTWAVPRVVPTGMTPPVAGPPGGGVLHAPTPTDERLTLPALCVATFPLDPTRRHVAPGPLTDALVDLAAGVYAELVLTLAERRDSEVGSRDGDDAAGGAVVGSAVPDPLDLVPVGLAAGPLDAALRSAVLRTLRGTAMLPVAAAAQDRRAHPASRTTPELALTLTGPARGSGLGAAALAALAPTLPGLVDVTPGHEAVLRALGVEQRSLADAVAELPAVPDAAHWHAVYDALAPAAADPLVREALASVPVPLVDGRVVRGPRGTVLLDAALADDVGPEVAVLERWGLRVVDPAAAHPLLERLGARRVDAAGLLADPATRRAVLDTADDEDTELAEQVADVVLALVARHPALLGDATAAPVWVSLLTLRDDEDEPVAARGLVLPGSVAAEVLDDRVLAPVAPELLERWGEDVLRAVGVRAGLAVHALATGVGAGTGALDGSEDGSGSGDEDLLVDSLDGWQDFLDEVGDASPQHAVADLDAVREDAWPHVLELLTADPAARAALLEPVSYTAWWLRTHAAGPLGLAGPFALPSAPPALRGVLGAPPEPLAGLVARADDAALVALGGVAAFAALDADATGRVLDRLGAAGDDVAPGLALALWGAWSSLDPDDEPRPPALLPALVGPDREAGERAGHVRLVPAEQVAVAPSPMWWQRDDLGAWLPGGADAEHLADVLDLPLGHELADGVVLRDGAVRSPVPEAVRTWASLSLAVAPPETWLEHDTLLVDGHEVEWWVDGAGPTAVVHAVHLAALARGLAQACGAWSHRATLETLLADPDRSDELTLEAVADEVRGRAGGAAL